ncbi:MAG: hypothetical protein RL026_314 [Pseudomonadota bacterium]|jgi:molybdopterin-guanine dinucleotide biosynthesis protein B
MTRVLGIAGWSGAGKTTLLASLIPRLVARGFTVSTLKHAHHSFDVDVPGKDSWRHRQAGAGEVMVVSGQRWVHMHELRGAAEPPLHWLLQRFAPCDLILVEGYKRSPLPKLEVHRPGMGATPLYATDPAIVVVASDGPLTAPHPPCIDLNDLEAVADSVLAAAVSLDEALRRLDPAG